MKSLSILIIFMVCTSCVSAETVDLNPGRYKELTIYFSPFNESGFSKKEFIKLSKTKINSTELPYINSMYNFLNEYEFIPNEKNFSEVNAKVMIEFYDPLEKNRLTLISDGKFLYSLQQNTYSSVDDDFLSLFSPAQVDFIIITSKK